MPISKQLRDGLAGARRGLGAHEIAIDLGVIDPEMPVQQRIAMTGKVEQELLAASKAGETVLTRQQNADGTHSNVFWIKGNEPKK